VHVVRRRFLASTSDHRQKSYDLKQHFLSPFKDPPTGQPYMEGLVPIAMAVSRITPLASSTPLSSLLELREEPHGLPLLFQGHPPFLGVLFSSKHHFSWCAEQTSAHSHSLLSNSLILRGQSWSQLAGSSRPLSPSSSVDVPRCPSEVKPRPWAWQSTPPSSNRTTP
jgi:hypothetical protein